MTLESLTSVFRALGNRSVRFIVVGGVAVNVQGYQRPTADLDLVVQLDRENVLAALKALESLGYRSVLPVDASDFADDARREQWREERGLEVFSMVSDRLPDLTVDIFAFHPFDFDAAFAGATVAGTELADTPVRFASPDTLIEMKRVVGRPRDLDDIENLRFLAGGASNGGDGRE
ncbi:MAG: hypothetical protein ACLFPV_16220 [Spirochaetaceae bacterium]